MSILFGLIKDLFARKPPQDEISAIHRLDHSLREQGKMDDALERYQKILATNPDHIDSLFKLGCALETHKPDEAINYFRRVLTLDQKHYAAKLYLLALMQNRCEWGSLKTDALRLRKVVRDSPITGKNQLPPFLFLTLPGTTAMEQKRCAERYSKTGYPQQFTTSLRRRLDFKFNPAPHTPIRLGYLSADFHDHATARLLVETFELHDRSRFHITAFSYGPNDGSIMRNRLENTFDNFVDIQGDSYEDAAKKIYSNHTDILVDLKGHTANNRSGILALRPAPIQVNYLGYPGTMGVDFVDYLIADRYIVPPEHLAQYTEKVVWLPDCYQPTDRSRQRLPAPPRWKCGLPEDGFVFCCFNQTYKITPDVFEVWCQLLKAVPGSSLWIWESNPHAAGNLKMEAEKRGINPERLVMAPTISDTAEHLARLQCADLFLDTLPYNAHTTCSDALWMGLPVVTCTGETFPSRVAGSLLTAIGVPELISYSLNDYYSLALDLATDRNKLFAIRNKIVANRDTAPLFNSERFTHNLENVYIQMMNSYTGVGIAK